jgi:NTE family protein
MQIVGGPSIFDGLPSDELDEELERLERRQFTAGQVMIAAGDRSHRLLVIQSGLADVIVTDRHGVEHRVGGAEPGSVLGEMAMMTNEPAAVTVRAVSEVDAIVLEPADFERMAVRFPQVYRNLGTILARKLQRADRLAAGDTPGVLVHLRDYGGPPLAAYALACSIAWHTRESVLLLARGAERYRELEPLVGTHRTLVGIDRADVLLEDVGEEQAFRDTVSNHFSRYATVVVLDLPGEVTLYTSVPLDLVPAGSPRPNADVLALRAWSAPGAVSAAPDCTYDVPALAAADETSLRDGLLPTATPAGKAVGRLAREVSGLTVGIALGSGSMRGYAHFGILKGLENAGLEVDYAAGTSVGAAAASLHLMGKTPAEGVAILDQFADQMFRFTLRGRWLLSNAGIRSLLKKVAGDTRIQDLPKPLGIVAADVDSHAEVVIRSGLVWQAVLASISIPGVYAAQRMGAYTLVDGGVVNPVPTSVAADMGAGVVLGVRLVSPREQLDRFAEAMPAKGRPPSAVAVLLRAIDMMQSRLDHDTTGIATVAIVPAFEHVPTAKLRHFKDGHAYFETGLQAAEAALPRIAAALPWLRP